MEDGTLHPLLSGAEVSPSPRLGTNVMRTVGNVITDALLVTAALFVADLFAIRCIFWLFAPSGTGPRATLAGIVRVSSAFAMFGLLIGLVCRLPCWHHPSTYGQRRNFRNDRDVLLYGFVGLGFAASALVLRQVWYGVAVYGLLVLLAFVLLLAVGRSVSIRLFRARIVFRPEKTGTCEESTDSAAWWRNVDGTS